jgi:hypothetical protein
MVMTYLIISFVFLTSCRKDDNDEKGNVSFGTNTDLLNCITTTKVFIDNEEMGIVPGYCDTIIDCFGDNTLNIELSTGLHSYKYEVSGQNGNCYREKTGDFILDKNECKKIFFDITKRDD